MDDSRIKVAESKALEIQNKLLHSRSELASNGPNDFLTLAERNFADLQNSASELLQAVIEFEVGVKYQLREVEQRLIQHFDSTKETPSQLTKSPSSATSDSEPPDQPSEEFEVNSSENSVKVKIEGGFEPVNLDYDQSVIHALSEITAVLKTEEVD